MDGLLIDLMRRMRLLAKDPRHGWVFPNSKGNAYTAQAFKLGANSNGANCQPSKLGNQPRCNKNPWQLQ